MSQKSNLTKLKFGKTELLLWSTINITDEDKKQIPGKHPIDYVNYFLERYDFDKEEYREKQRNNYYKLFDEVEVFEIVDEIKRLKKEGFLIGLTTTSSIKSTSQILERTQLDKIFDVVVTFEDCARRKPNPDPYLITAKKLGVNPEECLVVEDSSVGLEAAKSAGMKCIVIPNEFTRSQDFSKADFIIESAEEVERIIENLNLL